MPKRQRSGKGYAKSKSAKRRKTTPKKSPAAKVRKSGGRKSKALNPTLSKLVNLLGAGAGTFLGVGPTVGSSLAGSAHRAFKDITGYGDYNVSGNTLMKDDVPQFSQNGRHTRIKHREYIKDIITSATPGTFQLENFSINPGLAATFPWLSQVASNYEEYIIRGMIFEYKTMSSDALNSTNTALGSVIMASQYNVLSPDFTGKQQMENYEFACSVKPSNSLMHPIECDPKDTPIGELFTRSTGTIILGSDLRLYDFAKFYIATTGMQGASVNIGELWVSYDIELIKPKLSGNPDLLGDSFRLDLITTTAPLGGTRIKSNGSNLGTTVNNSSITFPVGFNGVVLISHQYRRPGASGTVATTFVPTGGPGVVAYNMYNNLTTNVSYLLGPVSSYALSMEHTWKITNGGIITFALAGTTDNLTTGDLIITQIPLF